MLSHPNTAPTAAQACSQAGARSNLSFTPPIIVVYTAWKVPCTHCPPSTTLQHMLCSKCHHTTLCCHRQHNTMCSYDRQQKDAWCHPPRSTCLPCMRCPCRPCSPRPCSPRPCCPCMASGTAACTQPLCRKAGRCTWACSRCLHTLGLIQG